MPKDIAQFLDAPVPGQGLTQDPEVPQQWETPPQITDIKEARELVFRQLIEPTRLPHMLTLVESGIPVSTIAMTVVKQGFKDGMWTPDLGLLLLEPTAIMVIAIAREFEFEPIIAEEGMAETASDQMAMLKQMQNMIPEGTKEPVVEEEMVPENNMPSLLSGGM